MTANEKLALQSIKIRIASGGLRLSNHAAQRCAERGITRGMMITALLAATDCRQQAPTKFSIPVLMGGREGRIVVEPKAGDLVEAVTVMWKTK